MMIRIATPADAIPLSELKRETFRETFLEEGFGIPYPPDDLAAFEAESYAPQTVAAQLADPARRTWVAVTDDGRLLGYAHVGPCKLPHPEVAEGDGEIYQLYLRRGAQGTGAGRTLIHLALDYLAQTRPGPVWLGVWSGNDKAIAFYERAGFGHVGNYEFEVGDARDLEFIYRRGPAERTT